MSDTEKEVVEQELEPQVEGQQEEGSEPEEPQTLRGQLEQNFEADRKAAEKAAKPKKYQSRAREADAEEETPAEVPPAEQSETSAPEAFAKEAKAEWANVPPSVQAAILKREQDMEKGVNELKSKYSDMDKVLQPHLEAIRAQGHTPAEAVNQLFAWMMALAGNPDQAFPALAQSFNYDLSKAIGQQTQQPQQEGQEQPPEISPEDLPPGVSQYISGLEQKLQQFEKSFNEKFTGLEHNFAAQSQAKTQEILDNWSRDKEYYEDVREMMAQLLQSGAVPLDSKGQVDLDAAYDRAMWAHPEVRAKVLAAQEQQRQTEAKNKAEAEKKAQAEQAAAARKAGVSINSSSPGMSGAASSGKPGKRKSVRESIMEAREQLSDT